MRVGAHFALLRYYNHAFMLACRVETVRLCPRPFIVYVQVRLRMIGRKALER